jgi:hypothetical protein
MNSLGTQLATQSPDTAIPKGRSLLGHLLHALNQPLTGLQCSMEVALTAPRQAEQYVSTLRDGLDLTARMRILVEAIRELADLPQDDLGSCSRFPLDGLLRETAMDLHPVAESRNVQLLTACQPALVVLADRRFLAAMMFRWLESALSLAGEGTELKVAATRDSGQAVLMASWTDGQQPDHAPFSKPELGLLIAQAGWERAGAEWERKRAASSHICTVRLPLPSSPANLPSTHLENTK